MSVANISRIDYAVTSIAIDVISLYWVLPYFHMNMSQWIIWWHH